MTKIDRSLMAAPSDLSAHSKKIWDAIVSPRTSVGRRVAIAGALRLFDTAQKLHAEASKTTLTSTTTRTKMVRVSPLLRLAHQAELDFLGMWYRLGLGFNLAQDGVVSFGQEPAEPEQ